MTIAVLSQACSGDFWIAGKVRVQILNDLPGGVTLTVHCQSKDNDLGFHQIPPNGMWEFRFKPNFWGNTLFFCSFQWPNQFHHHDVFVEDRDVVRCQGLCQWHVKPLGPCLNDFICDIWDS
ncbi:hypothetical protein EUGRSUZ_H01296 [Eucalyptus grandis]|uniref:Uncharacterized protein n=2 Tax=Eucalyptus grandis TaxID=71139 RepID=A0ACC3JQ01_EUCGR|nr:hypothetical protein EUGRSUZ_H01296 [Eucalyptus grandis]